MSIVPASFVPFWMQPAETERPTHTWVALGAFATISAAGALYAAVYTPSLEGNWGWYQRILKPAWTPNPELAGYISVVLHMLFAIAGWRIWRTGAFRAVPFTGLGFGAVLFFQSIWSTLFYGLQSPLLGGVDFGLITLLSVLLWLTYRTIDDVAAWLWLPVVVFSAYSFSVNLAIWRMNP
jgi:tryptophan-rich sensory protein